MPTASEGCSGLALTTLECQLYSLTRWSLADDHIECQSPTTPYGPPKPRVTGVSPAR